MWSHITNEEQKRLTLRPTGVDEFDRCIGKQLRVKTLDLVFVPTPEISYIRFEMTIGTGAAASDILS